MKKNMGTIDRVIRVVISAIFACLFFTKQVSGTLGTVLIIAATVLVVTSFISFCPLYYSVGFKTVKKNK